MTDKLTYSNASDYDATAGESAGGAVPAVPPAYPSLRKFAAAIPRSHKTLLTWMRRDDWPDEVDRNGPWTDADVARVREWAADTIRPDRTGHHDPDEADDRYFTLRGDYPPVTIPRDAELGTIPTRDWRRLPPMLVSESERAVLEGRCDLTPDQTRQLVERGIRFRALMVEACDTLPPWLVRLSAPEIARRMRGEVYERCVWARNVMNNITAPPKADGGEDGAE